MPKAEEQVRKDNAPFKESELKTSYTDDGGKFKDVCHNYLDNADL